VVAIASGFGMIPLVAPNFFKALPDQLGPILHSGILLSALSAVVLNLFFNGTRQTEPPRDEVVLPPPAGVAGARSH
jgi:NCS2 family nucleobase:cation symporter-2